ncbi:MAG: hypothetical protein R3C30_03635 [Hyphomonadaceae bacterium]
MNRNALPDVLWRTIGGVFGVALLISTALALGYLFRITGIDLA